jgi:Tol biopolymer transport system component
MAVGVISAVLLAVAVQTAAPAAFRRDAAARPGPGWGSGAISNAAGSQKPDYGGDAKPAKANLPRQYSFVAGGAAVGSFRQDFGSLQLMTGSATLMPALIPGAKNPDVNWQRTLVVFEAYPGFTWIMNSDGSGIRQLSPTDGSGWMEPRFAPDGATVVTTHDVGGGRQEIFAIDVVTGAATQLTDAPRYPWKWRPSIDPSGSRLIVTYGTDSNASSGPHSHIGTASLSRGLIADFTPLTEVDPGRPSYDGEFSPTGSSIIFDAGSQIWVAAADGSGAHAVAAGRLGRFDPFSPDHILFTHDVGPRNSHTQLWGAATDGSEAQMLADGNFVESFCVLT